MHGWPSIQRRRKWVSGRIVHSLLTNCAEMSVFGSYWKTWYFVVCEQACACYNNMDKILWQTLGAFDLLHSSDKWIPAILLCGKHCTTMQTGIVSRLWFCRRPWRLKISIKRNSVHFRKYTLVPINWMCKKQTSVSHSSTEAEIFFSRCKLTHGRYSRSHSLGFSDWNISFRTEQNWWTQERAMEKPVSSCQAKHA